VLEVARFVFLEATRVCECLVDVAMVLMTPFRCTRGFFSHDFSVNASLESVQPLEQPLNDPPPFFVAHWNEPAAITPGAMPRALVLAATHSVLLWNVFEMAAPLNYFGLAHKLVLRSGASLPIPFLGAAA